MNFLIHRVMIEHEPFDGAENRTRLGMLAGWISTALSVVLCLLKGWLGLVSGSVSLMADATNNLMDAGSSLIIALGFQWSRKPSDEEHPFGHGRIETVITLVLAIALVLVGVEVAKSGFFRLLSPKPVVAPLWLIIVLSATIVTKLWMAIFAKKLARLSKSHVLEVDAWNHTFDVASTLLVGVALLGSKLGWSAIDGWMAILVALFILGTGIKYARESIDILLGKNPDPDEMKAIHHEVKSISGVLDVHDIIVHQYGDLKMISYHIEVDDTLNLIHAHEIANKTERAIQKNLGWQAVVHIDPVAISKKEKA